MGGGDVKGESHLKIVYQTAANGFYGQAPYTMRELFSEIEDPRRGNAKKYKLHEMLVIALCTVLCGGETCADMALFGRSRFHFLQQLLRLENSIPSHDTFSRLFRLLDPEKFHAWFLAFMRRFAEGC